MTESPAGAAGTDVCFGKFRLQPGPGRLLHEEREITLQPKAWDVLCCFVERPGDVISIDELLDRCWPELHVGPHAVSNIVYKLRAVFVAGGGDAQWIQSVARRGYRFTAPLRVEAPTHPDAAPAAAPEVLAAQPTLFVGRQQELALLEHHWLHTQRGAMNLVFIAGEPGIGKTTLVDQFITRLVGDRLTARAQCIEQSAAGEPYMAVIEALGSLPSVEQLVEVAREQAPTWLIQMPWLIPREERASLRQLLAGGGAARMLREGKRLFAALAERMPILVVLEDLHWADGATVDLIRALATDPRPCRMMLLATYRPTELVVHHHPLRTLVAELTARQRNVHRLDLGAFSPALVREYLTRRFASPALAGAIAAPLEERSGGNPLFLGAMTEYLCEQHRIVAGAEGWQLADPDDDLKGGLPEGLRDLIRVHLNRLGTQHRRLLEAASAVGVDFTTVELAAALEMPAATVAEACDELASTGHFIRAVGEVDWPDGCVGETYRFAHVVYHQCLAEDVPPARRRALHERIGQRLEIGYGRRAREIAPRLAHHFAAAKNLDREFEYLKLSVQLAAGRYAHRETLAYIDRTIDVLGRLPSNDERRMAMLGWQVERGNLLMDWQGYAAGFDSFTVAAELAQREGNALLEFIAHAGRCTSALMGRTHREEAPAIADTLLRIADDGNPELTSLAHVLAGCVRDSFGDPAAALAHAEAALQALPHALLGLPRGFDLETVIHVMLVTVLTRRGMSGRADDERRLVMHRVQTRAGLASQAHACAFLACDALIAAQPQQALDYAERGIAAAREGGFHYFEIAAQAALEVATSMLAADDEIDVEGLARLAALIEERRALDENWYNMLFAAYLADAHRRRGEIEQARVRIDATFAEAEAVYVAELWRLKGEIELAGGRGNAKRARTAAAQCFQSAIDLARQGGTRLFELRSTMALARLLDGADGTRDALDALCDSFSADGDSPDLRSAGALLRQFDSRH